MVALAGGRFRGKIKKVPSDPIHSIAHHRLARPETGIRECRALVPSLPGWNFRSGRITVPEPACKLFPIGASSSQRPFARPERLPVSGPPFRGQRSRSAASLQHRPCPEPVRPDTPPLRLVCPRPRRLQRAKPVARSCEQRSRKLAGSPLPFGVLKPLRIVAFNPPHFREARRIQRPIFLRSPKPVYFTSSDFGSTFRTRYAASGLLFLEPLGTSFIMDPPRLGVK